jgi:hypothetical protein
VSTTGEPLKGIAAASDPYADRAQAAADVL